MQLEFETTTAPYSWKGTVRRHQQRRPHPQHFLQGLFSRLLGDGRSQPPDRLAFLLSPLVRPGQGLKNGRLNHLAKRNPLRCRFSGREMRPVPDRTATSSKHSMAASSTMKSLMFIWSWSSRSRWFSFSRRSC